MFTGSKSKFKLLNVNLNILNYDDTSLELVRKANDLNVYVNVISHRVVMFDVFQPRFRSCMTVKSEFAYIMV